MGRRRASLPHVAPRLRQIYAYFWPEFRNHRGAMLLAVLALLGSVILRLLEPWPFKVFLDRVAPQAMAAVTSVSRSIPHSSAGSGVRPSVDSWLPWIARSDPQSIADSNMSPSGLLLAVTLATVAIAAARACCDFASNMGFFKIGNRAIVRIRDRVFRHVLQLPLAYHQRARTGDLLVRVTRDVSLLRDVTSTAVLPLVASVLVLTSMVGVMLWLQPFLAVVSLATVPLFWAVTARVGRRIRESSRRQRVREGAMASTAAECLGSMVEVKALCLEGRFAEEFGQRNRESQKDDLQANRYAVRLSRTVDLLLAIAGAVVLWLGGRMVLQGVLTPGLLLVFLVYLKRSFKPSQDFAKYTARLAKAAAAGERIIELLQRSPEVDGPLDGMPLEESLPDPRGSKRHDGTMRVHDCVAPSVAASPVPIRGIRFDHVDFSYDAGHWVLRDIDLFMASRTTTAIVGASGSGKSTLLHLMLRLFDPVRGHVLLDGWDLQELTLAAVRSRYAFVPQDCLLFAGTIRDNIALAAPDLSDDEICAAVQLANAEEFIARQPLGLDTPVGERGITLSRGQRQRLAVARAAACRSEILLLDEPTTGLDESNKRAVIEGLLRLAGQRTTIMVTHEAELAGLADHVVSLELGCIVEAGPPRNAKQRQIQAPVLPNGARASR